MTPAGKFRLTLLALCGLLLPLQLAAQNTFSGIIEFDKTVHDFGDLLLSDGEQECVFSFTNIGREPLVIHNIVTSCGCTDPDWTRQPVLPGKSGEIRVTFKNDLGPYPFDKALTVYVSGLNKPLILRIRGIVHEKPKSLKERFPVQIGGLGFRELPLTLGQTEQGVVRSEKTQVANLTGKPLKVGFAQTDPGLILEVAPNPVPAGGTATLAYGIDTRAMETEQWGRTVLSSGLLLNGKTAGTRIQAETLIKENFAAYTASERKNGSLPQFDESSRSFGRIKAGTGKTVTFKCRNYGKAGLRIYKVDTNDPDVTVDYPSAVAPGQSGEIRVTVRPARIPEEGEALYILTLVTNSPVRPLISLFVTGIVE